MGQKILRNTVAVAVLAAAALDGAAYAQQGASDSGADRSEDESRSLDTVIVRGTEQDRYNADTTDLGKMQQEILKIPRSVQVIPEQVILDQQAYDLGDALKNVGGVTDGDGFGGTLTDFLIRGFRRNSIYRNGVRLSAVTNNQPPTQNIEALEIIKGPASVLFGQIEPGGLVNINTKKPSFETRSFAQAVFDEHGKRLATFDLTGPLSGDTLAFRLNASLEDSDTFRDFYTIKREFISPSLLWRVTPETEITFTYEYFRDNRPLDRGFVSLPDGNGGRFIPENIPLSRRFGEDYEERDSKVHLIETILTHQFSDTWEGNISLMYRTEDEFDIQVRPLQVDTAGNLARRVDGTNDRTVETFNFSGWISGEATTGSIEHLVSFGMDYRDESEDRFFSVGTPAVGFNIFNPVYGLIEDSRTPPGDPRALSEAAFGVFVQDQVFLTEKLSVLAGLRYDQTEGDSLAGGNITDFEQKTQVTPQLGVLYQPTETTSLYASYSEGFNPTTTVDPLTGETFDPTESAQYEVGAKARLFDERVQVSGAIYDLTKTNIVALNTMGALDLVGEVRSRGLELDVSGELLPGFNILGSYAYIDNEILTETNANVGNRTGNVAEHTFRVWGSYEVREGTYAGLGGGAGINYTSDRFGDDSNTWSLGDYTLVDASLWYYLDASAIGLGEGDKQIRLGLSAKNILDERYFPAAGNSLRINIGRPRTVLASIGVAF